MASLLSPKEQARLKSVREMLATGLNPYEEFAKGNKEAGGGEIDKQEKAKRIEVFSVRSEQRVKALETKWSDKNTPTDRLSLPLLDLDLGPANTEEEIPEGKFRCTFCRKIVDQVNVTMGVSKPRKIITTVLTQIDDKTVYEEKITHMVDKLVACPDCCLKIKPSYNSKGEMTSKGVKFPETEG